MMFSKLNLGFFLGFILFTEVVASANTSLPLDRVAAVVNDKVITQSQLNAAITEISHVLQAAGQPLPSQAKLQQETLDQLIANSLQLQLAERNKVQITDQQLDDSINKIAAKNHLTLSQLKEALKQQGMNFTRFRSRLMEQMTIHELQQRIFAGQIPISKEEVQAYMTKFAGQNNANRQYRLDDLVIPLSEAASQEAVATAEKQGAENCCRRLNKGLACKKLPIAPLLPPLCGFGLA